MILNAGAKGNISTVLFVFEMWVLLCCPDWSWTSGLKCSSCLSLLLELQVCGTMMNFQYSFNTVFKAGFYIVKEARKSSVDNLPVANWENVFCATKCTQEVSIWFIGINSENFCYQLTITKKARKQERKKSFNYFKVVTLIH